MDDDDHAELAEINENMVRNPLTALQFTVQLARRKVLYLEIHPETRHGNAPQKKGKGVGKGKATKEVKNISLVEAPPADPAAKAFIHDAAETLGTSPSKIKKDVYIGANLVEAAVEILEGTRVADDRRALMEKGRERQSD